VGGVGGGGGYFSGRGSKKWGRYETPEEILGKNFLRGVMVGRKGDKKGEGRSGVSVQDRGKGTRIFIEVGEEVAGGGRFE